MRSFAELYNRLDETSDYDLRVKALVDYLQDAQEADKIWAIALLADKRPSKVLPLAKIKMWGQEASNLPQWLFDESLKSVGDVIETVSLVIPRSEVVVNESIAFWLNHIATLSKSDEEAKKAGVLEAWNLIDADARFIFNKLLSGGFRVIYPQQLLTKAISLHTGKSIPHIAHRLISKWNPKKTSFDELFLSDHKDDDIGSPYPFLSAQYLEQEAEILGKAKDWQAEYKWDGIRIQLLLRDDRIFIWTREQELITPKIPEFEELSFQLPNGTVLDGELLAFKFGKPMPLKSLVRRMAKKKITKKIIEETPVIFMAYDILEYNAEDFRTKEFHIRRSKLEQLINKYSTHQLLKLSPVVKFMNWSNLADILKKVRSNQAVGLVIKKNSSIYGKGNKSGGWWKWKVPQLAVKTVLLYAQTSGWSGGESNFTFAVWEGEQLVPLTKTMVGLTKEERTEITSFVKKNTVERFGPVRSVKPDLVFELIFDTIDHSSRHKCGVVLRNPSVLKWHKEMEANEANSLEEVKALLNAHE